MPVAQVPVDFTKLSSCKTVLKQALHRLQRRRIRTLPTSEQIVLRALRDYYMSRNLGTINCEFEPLLGASGAREAAMALGAAVDVLVRGYRRVPRIATDCSAALSHDELALLQCLRAYHQRDDRLAVLMASQLVVDPLRPVFVSNLNRLAQVFAVAGLFFSAPEITVQQN